MGIHNFEDILKITASVRTLLDMDAPKWKVSVADEKVKPQTKFIEQKCRTGKKIDGFTVEMFDESGFECFLRQEEL